MSRKEPGEGVEIVVHHLPQPESFTISRLSCLVFQEDLLPSPFP